MDAIALPGPQGQTGDVDADGEIVDRLAGACDGDGEQLDGVLRLIAAGAALDGCAGG